MSSITLSQRLNSLSDTYKSTLALIQELQKFPTATSPLSDDLDEQRLELANSCHQSLKDAEESLELLRQEVDDYDPGRARNRRVSGSNAREEEHERNATTVSRLSEDIRSARGQFRRAQLQSKRHLDNRRQKEREQLFANRRGGGANGTTGAGMPAARKNQEKLTQDEMATNAAEDVTRALRRTHATLVGNLQQSAFAQQTLEESQEQLQTLAQRYQGTTDILQKSRGLVKTLMTSQKSDTWYLQTSVYILLVTIAWLVFRRLLYGPLWWLCWVPIKFTYWVVSLVFGGIIGAAGGGKIKNGTLSMVGTKTGLDVPKNTPGMQYNYHAMPAKGAGWGGRGTPEEKDMPPSPEMVEEMKQMIKDADEGIVVVQDDTEQPRNPKKRMMELEKEQAMMRDEL